jgi:hypothetical protein
MRKAYPTGLTSREASPAHLLYQELEQVVLEEEELLGAVGGLPETDDPHLFEDLL